MTPAVTITSPALNEALSRKGKEIVSNWEWTEFQQRVLCRNEFEIFAGGGKFGGKSAAARGFLLKGNPDKSSIDANTGFPTLDVNFSYVYHPNYRATILRRNEKDLDDFLRKFELLATPLGGRYVRGMFEFPSGAVITCGHLADKDAWQKYIGVENVRFVIEEAALIPEYHLFDQVRTCCRSVWPEMQPQILLTSNAGGPGTGWLIDRFYEAKDEKGEIIPPGTTIHEVIEHEGMVIDKTRVFMFSTYRDNPHAKNDPGYIGTLVTIQDDKTRAAYLDGEWRAFTGTYFSIFRPKGPLRGEPANANHVIPPNPSSLQPWWFRLGSIDVGYAHETAVLWGCQNPITKQLHVYKELVVSGTSYVQIGFEIASRSISELERLPSHSITFWISHDAIHNRAGEDQKSIAELIMLGIARKLGKDAVHFPELKIMELRKLAESSSYGAFGEEERKWAELMAKAKTERRAGITLRVAPRERVIGWQYCLESMRFMPIGDALPPYDAELAGRLYHSDPSRWEEYDRLYRNRTTETLPMLQIWDRDEGLGPMWGCPRLIDAIPRARHADPPKNPEDVDPQHFTGMDSLDGWRYLLMGLQDTSIVEPYESYRDRQISEYHTANPNADTSDLIWLNRHLEAKWADEKGGSIRSFTLPRKSMVMRMGGPAMFAKKVGKLIGGSSH